MPFVSRGVWEVIPSDCSCVSLPWASKVRPCVICEVASCQGTNTRAVLIVVTILACTSAPCRQSSVVEMQSWVTLHLSSGVSLTKAIANGIPISMGFVWQFKGGTAVIKWSTFTALSTFVAKVDAHSILAGLTLTLAVFDTIDIIIATKTVILHVLTWNTVDVVLNHHGVTVVRTVGSIASYT